MWEEDVEDTFPDPMAHSPLAHNFNLHFNIPHGCHEVGEAPMHSKHHTGLPY